MARRANAAPAGIGQAHRRRAEPEAREATEPFGLPPPIPQRATVPSAPRGRCAPQARRQGAGELAHCLAQNAEAVCRHYLSNGRRSGGYWHVGDVANTPGQSLYVRLAGSRAGKWCDAATAQHGDLLDLIAASCKLASLKQALAEARHFLEVPATPAPEPNAAPPTRRWPRSGCSAWAVPSPGLSCKPTSNRGASPTSGRGRPYAFILPATIATAPRRKSDRRCWLPSPTPAEAHRWDQNRRVPNRKEGRVARSKLARIGGRSHCWTSPPPTPPELSTKPSPVVPSLKAISKLPPCW